MHIPRGAVVLKMQAEGLDTKLLDQDPNAPFTAPSSSLRFLYFVAVRGQAKALADAVVPRCCRWMAV